MRFWNFRFVSILAVSLCSVVFASGSAASAAELKLMATVAIKEFIIEVVAGFEKSSNHKVQLITDTGPNAKMRASAGEAFDVIVIGPDLVDELIREAKVRQGTAAAVT